MEELVYRPDIYEGKDPYIYVSYHPDDRGRVISILEQLDRRGVRFWIEDGITPGMETDEIIAEHIEGCDFFIAFLSESYLGFLDKVDELNYSRDVNKDYLLVYLDEIVLPQGLDMRFMRAQNIQAYSYNGEEVFLQLMNIDGIHRFYGIADSSLRDKAQRVFDKLEKYYPEHKVFALDAVNGQLREEISNLYIRAGYPSIERLLLDYGFVQISTEVARSLRSSVLYSPGMEPDIVKSRIDYMMATLERDYPDKVITGQISVSHKSIYKSLLGISIWMGYDSLAEMLTAYGFQGVSSEAGRGAIDHKEILEQLFKRYENKEKPSSITQLILENPDIKGNIKTINNRSNELFGMTLLQYLKHSGLIVSMEPKEKISQIAKDRIEIIEEIRRLYADSKFDYGDFEEAEKTLDQLVVKKNKKKQKYIISSGFSDEILKIPYGIDFIAKEAFAGLSDMKTLILPPTIREIREAAFLDCDGMETIIFAEGIEQIGNNAFTGCTSLKKVVFPKTLKGIGHEAFAGCEQLEEVEFKNLRVNIQEDAFDGCIYELEKLSDQDASPTEFFELKIDKKNNAKIIAYTGDEEVVVIPGMIGGHPILSIEKGCFKGNELVREIYMSDCIGAINGDAFKECKNLTKIHISESVTSLTASAFAGCINLSEANIPDRMIEVQRGVFKDSPLTTLYIGKGTSKFSPDALYKGEADMATGIYFKKKALENLIIDRDNESFKAEGSTLLSCDGKVLYAELGDPVQAVIPEGVEEIWAQAYEKLGSLCEVIFPATLRKIGEKAFAGTNIKTVELPGSVEILENQAFSFCRALSTLEINEELRVIGDQAFEGCPITEVYIPASVESIGKDSFLSISTYQGEVPQRFRVDTANPYLVADGIALYQKSEEGMTLIKAYHPGLRSKIGEDAPELIQYSIMEGTTSILAHAFARCNNLTSVLIPEGVREIGDLAFWDCSRLTEIHLPESCLEVSPKAFFGITIHMI